MLIRLLANFLCALTLGAHDNVLRIPSGYKAEVIANEAVLSNVVSFSIDESGRFFVAESHRQIFLEASSEEDDALRSLEDRIEFLRRKNAFSNTNQSERILLLEDKNDDGRFDVAKVFAKNFNRPIDGQAGGILARDGNVFFACAPDLWVLRDNKRQSLHTGFGIHIRNQTHNLRNPILGPDGRLYFTIGNQGFHVPAHEGLPLIYPDEGAVLRCETNGASLEVYARGFTDPRGLAFGEFGDLFVVDENSLIHVIEGAWATNFPPMATFPSHPTSLAHKKGTFYLGDTNTLCGFKFKTNGLTFTIETETPLVFGASPNHIDFGPRTGIYFSEFPGRIYRLFDPTAESTTNASLNEATLGHLTAIIQKPTNLVIAVEAVSSIGKMARYKDAAAVQVLVLATKSSDSEIRAQAAKYLGDVKDSHAGPALVQLLTDPNPRVQFFAAQSLARVKHKGSQSLLSVLSFTSKDPHLQFAAARALQELQK